MISIKDKMRFFNKINFSLTGCWEWSANTGAYGYGQFCLYNKPQRAHRVSWLIFNGRIPLEYVCHKCDNKKCVNPRHLFLGSAKDNTDDMMRKKRNKAPRKLTEKQVLFVRVSDFKGVKLADMFNVDPTVISNIRNGKMYKGMGETE